MLINLYANALRVFIITYFIKSFTYSHIIGI